MMININIDSVSSLIGSVIILTFAINFFTSYLYVKKEPLNLVLALSTFSFFLYLSGYAIYSSSTDPRSVLFWTRICYSAGVLIVYTSFLFSSSIINNFSKRINRFLLVFVAIFLVFVFLPTDLLFTKELSQVKTHSSVIKGPLFLYFLLVIYLLDFLLIIRFIIGLFKNRNQLYYLAPILAGLVFWFLEALYDGIFGAILSMANMKLSLGPIFMTFCLAVYSGRYAEKKSKELIQIKEENRIIYNNMIYDSLSTLYTRQYFIEAMEQRIAFKTREEVNDSILFIDVDNFKNVNDELGHKVGDLLIKYIGDTLRKYSRKSDICARFGGDEFVMLLENSNGDESVRIAENISQGFTLGLPDLLNNWSGCSGVSFSIGIIGSKHWTSDSEDIIHKADLAMYKAKRHGKNSICCYSASDT